MPYISVSVLRFQIFNRKILPPQHMGVKPFSDYPVAAEGYLHDPAPQWRHNRARLTEQSLNFCKHIDILIFQHPPETIHHFQHPIHGKQSPHDYPVCKSVLSESHVSVPDEDGYPGIPKRH